MLRKTISVPFMGREVLSPHQYHQHNVLSRTGSALINYQTVRNKQKGKGPWIEPCKFHAHIKFNRLGNTKPRKALVDPKLMKVGEPASSTIALGDMVQARKFEWDLESLNARGFNRFQKPYTPPANITQDVMDLCRSCLNSNDDESSLLQTKLNDPKQKFELLAKAHERFQYGVPNSLLYMIKTIGDVVNFYNTPVKTTTPFEELVRNPNLPPNLYVQKEPLRFHPDTDTKFNGESAFPKSQVIVTGLRAKKIYRGYEGKMTWP